MILRTREGALGSRFLEPAGAGGGADSERNQPIDGIQTNVWVARSFDEGKTRPELQMVEKGYCGAVCDLIQTREGNLVFVAQDLVPRLARRFSGAGGVRG